MSPSQLTCSPRSPFSPRSPCENTPVDVTGLSPSPQTTSPRLHLAPPHTLTFSPDLPDSPSSPARPGTPGMPGLPGSPGCPGGPSGPRSPTARPMGPWGPGVPGSPLSPLGPRSPGKPKEPCKTEAVLPETALRQGSEPSPSTPGLSQLQEPPSQPRKQEWGRVLGLVIEPGSTHLSAWGPPFSWIPPTALLAPQPLGHRQK